MVLTSTVSITFSIKTLQNNFPKNVIGFSDHTLGIDIAVFSTFYGAKVIEKHFTFDNDLKTSPDHRLSLTHTEFQKMVNQINLSRVSRGSSNRLSFSSESEAVKYARRSIVSNAEIKENTVITEDLLDIKRPGTGIPPKFFNKILGMKTIRNIPEDTPIQWEDLSQKNEN